MDSASSVGSLYLNGSGALTMTGNLLTVARGLLAAAARRTESRGNHSRAEFTLPDPAWRRRQVLIEESA